MAEIYKTFSITLDKKKPITNEEFEIVEGDTGNKLEITVLEDGVAVDLSNSDIYIIFSHDGITVEQDTVSVGGDVSVGGTDDNIITVLLHSSSYALNGLTECEIKIVSGTTGATWITTPLFNLKSRRSLLNDETIQAVTEFPILAELITRVEELGDREQSDWDQTDDTKGNFIQNKPVVGADFQDATQNLTAETALAAADTIPFYDASASAHRKTTWANLVQKIFGSITGLVKADGAGNISAAVANTDFAAATHASRHASGAADAVTPTSIKAVSYGESQTLSDSEKAQALTNIGGESASVRLTNQTVSTSGWATYTAAAGEETLIQAGGFTYRKSLALTGVTSGMRVVADPSFDVYSCGAIICGVNIAYDGGIYLYARFLAPTSAFTLSTVTAHVQ